MFRRRIAIVGSAAVIAGLGTASGAWANNSGPPQPSFNDNEQTLVCHGYPGAFVDNRHGTAGTPDTIYCVQ